MFKQATRSQSKLRMTIDGPAGSGKSYTAMRLATTLAGPQGKIAAIDTERGSLSKYVGEAPDGIPWAFDVVELKEFSPERYTELIQIAGRMGYDVLVIDSLSHAWEGSGGALDLKDKASGNGKGNDYTAWRTITPLHNRMIDAILQSPLHVITTMRSRMDYVMETNEQGKVTGIRRIGLAPIQRPGMEYEFDVVCDIDWSHMMRVSKSRCSAIADMIVEKPGPGFMLPIMDWLSSGNTQTAPKAAEFIPAADSPSPLPSPVGEGNVQSGISLDMLVEGFGADAVLTANNGQIPATQAEVDAAAKALGVL